MIILVSEKIRQIFESKLNDNTKDQKFIVGSYVQRDDDKKDYVYNVRNGYELISNQYVSCMIEPNIDYEPIPQTLTGYATISVKFLLYSDDKDIFNEQLNATEEIIYKIVGNYQAIEDGATTYDSVWSMDGLIPIGQTRPLNGVYYTQISTTLYVYFSKDFKMGNKYQYYLGNVGDETITYNRIYPFDGNEERQNTENNPHRLTDYEAKGGNEESAWTAEFVINVNDFIETNFLNEISSETYDLTKEFWYKEVIDESTTNVFKVAVVSMTKPYVLGDIQSITIKLIKSDIPE